jgi:hypothetical protein
MKVLAWYIDPNGIKNKNIVKYPYPTPRASSSSCSPRIFQHAWFCTVIPDEDFAP